MSENSSTCMGVCIYVCVFVYLFIKNFCFAVQQYYNDHRWHILQI